MLLPRRAYYAQKEGTYRVRESCLPIQMLRDAQYSLIVWYHQTQPVQPVLYVPGQLPYLLRPVAGAISGTDAAYGTKEFPGTDAAYGARNLAGTNAAYAARHSSSERGSGAQDLCLCNTGYHGPGIAICLRAC